MAVNSKKKKKKKKIEKLPKSKFNILKCLLALD